MADNTTTTNKPTQSDFGFDRHSLVVVDMDGVAADFVGAACDLHRQDRATATQWNFFADWEVHGRAMTPDEFWAPIDREGANFWRRLPVLPGVKTVLDQLEGFNLRWVFCTDCSRRRGALEGKRAWADTHFGPKAADELVAARHKHLLARPGRLLIDDKLANIEAFKRRGAKRGSGRSRGTRLTRRSEPPKRSPCVASAWPISRPRLVRSPRLPKTTGHAGSN